MDSELTELISAANEILASPFDYKTINIERFTNCSNIIKKIDGCIEVMKREKKIRYDDFISKRQAIVRKQAEELRDFDLVNNNISELVNYIKNIECLQTKLREMHSKELSVIEAITGKKDCNTHKSWASVLTYDHQARKPIQLLEEPQETQFHKIRISENTTIKARIVETLNDIKERGILYYIRKNKIFGILIMDMVLFGSIGTIYPFTTSQPYKIVTCKHGPNCPRNNDCNFYHEPLECPDSQDVRNFTNQNWIYNPNANNTMYCRIGDRNQIDNDKRQLSTEEKHRYFSQTMHTILCSLVINDEIEYK